MNKQTYTRSSDAALVRPYAIVTLDYFCDFFSSSYPIPSVCVVLSVVVDFFFCTLIMTTIAHDALLSCYAYLDMNIM